MPAMRDLETRLRALALAAFFLLAAPAGAREALSAHEVATGLARLGPRPADRPADQTRAVAFLLDAMRRAGLSDVRPVPVPGQPELVNLEGVLPGKSDLEVVLSAHYDTVSRSPGAGDDASGCGVVLAAAADLKRTPLDHTVRVVLFDGEEKGLLGSRAWVDALPPERASRILANLNVEMVGWTGSAGPVIHTFPVKAGEERVMPPAWLSHFLLKSGEAVDWPLSVADNRYPVLTQLVLRSARVGLAADSNNFLARGIPAVALSDSSLLVLDPAYHSQEDAPGRLDAARLGRWTDLIAATVRRLDGLAGRPSSEDRYLAAFGRVWSHRDLLWAGFLLWRLLVFRGRPGRWRGTSAAEHGRQMHTYLPGFLFRVLLLVAIFLAPVFSVLLFPAAALSLTPPRRVSLKILWIVLGLLPLLFFLGALGFAAAEHMVSLKRGFQGGWAAAVLIPAVFLLYGIVIARPERNASLPQVTP
jgi:hypothetical protein